QHGLLGQRSSLHLNFRPSWLPILLIKVVAAFSQNPNDFFLKIVSPKATRTQHLHSIKHDVGNLEGSMPRFFFHLTSVNRNITDDTGKELGTLNDAYNYARKLIDKILLYVGSDDVNSWKVVIFSDNHNAQIVVPFPVSCSPTQSEGQAIQHDAGGP